MLDRKFWDEVLPEGCSELRSIARNLRTWDMGTHPLYGALLLLAQITEEDRFSGRPTDQSKLPEWRRDGHPECHHSWYNISASGLGYKPSYNYLTSEGWPLGTTCWYVRVEHGWRMYAAAEDPYEAALRGVALVAAALRCREIAPSKRPHITDMLRTMAAPL